MARTDYRLLVNRRLPLLEQACRSKAWFLTRDEAKASVRRGRRRPDGSIKPYRCPFEDHWHLGHRARRDRRAAARRLARFIQPSTAG